MLKKNLDFRVKYVGKFNTLNKIKYEMTCLFLKCEHSVWWEATMSHHISILFFPFCDNDIMFVFSDGCKTLS